MRIQYYDKEFKVVRRYSHYDLTWEGLGTYKNQLWHFTTKDETDYDLMEAMCPCCMVGGSEDWNECNCDSYIDVWCELTPATLWEKVGYFLRRKK